MVSGAVTTAPCPPTGCQRTPATDQEKKTPPVPTFARRLHDPAEPVSGGPTFPDLQVNPAGPLRNTTDLCGWRMVSANIFLTAARARAHE